MIFSFQSIKQWPAKLWDDQTHDPTLIPQRVNVFFLTENNNEQPTALGTGFRLGLKANWKRLKTSERDTWGKNFKMATLHIFLVHPPPKNSNGSGGKWKKIWLSWLWATRVNGLRLSTSQIHLFFYYYIFIFNCNCLLQPDPLTGASLSIGFFNDVWGPPLRIIIRHDHVRKCAQASWNKINGLDVNSISLEMIFLLRKWTDLFFTEK